MAFNPNQPYLSGLSKGQTCTGRVIKVGNAPTAYQDKDQFPVCFRSLDDPDGSDEVKASDFQAMEVCFRGQASFLAKEIGKPVTFVIISPGNGKPAWVKLDQPMVASGLEAREKMYVAQQSFRIAADLIIADKSDGMDFKHIDELAKRIADKTIALSKQL